MKHQAGLLVLAILGTIGLPPATRAAEVTFRVTVPLETPPDAVVHLAGDFQSWQPGDPDYRLAKADDGRRMITLSFEPGRALQFKFTLGDWGSVEKGPRGQEIENRLHRVRGDETLDLQVASWAHGETRASSLSGDIRQLTVPEFLDGRRVWVYLPPGYDGEPDRRYPVLYMMDGQNVFDDATSFAGEWKVDETLEELIPAGRVAPLIVVAVANGGDQRTREYTPWSSSEREAGGGGGKHLQTWIDVLLPYVDAHFRTLAGPDNTGLAGSSLGGLMTLFAACTHADVFGKFGSFSPSIRWAQGRLSREMAKKASPGITVYMDMGSREEGNLQDFDNNAIDDNLESLRRLRDILTGRGFVCGWDLMVVEGENHRHNEGYWAQRFPAAAEFLFPGDF